jgi:hypothetical protein
MRALARALESLGWKIGDTLKLDIYGTDGTVHDAERRAGVLSVELSQGAGALLRPDFYKYVTASWCTAGARCSINSCIHSSTAN